MHVDLPAAAPYDGLHRADRGPEAPFAAVHLTVAEARGVLAVGLAADRDRLVAAVDQAAGTACLERVTGGRTTRLAVTPLAPLRAGDRVGFALCENRGTLLVDRGGGWRPVLTARPDSARHPDLRDPDVLEQYRYAWGATGGTTGDTTGDTAGDTAGDTTGDTTGGTVVAGAVRAGLFGMTGLRDLHLVQHADGTPYVRDGRLHLTATCAGLGFFRQAHWGVFTLDPARPDGLEQVAQLFTRRGGLVLGDHAGQLVRHEGRWVVLTSAWGDFAPGAIHVRHTTTDADLLRGVHLLETERLDLPTPHTSWDPGLTRIDGRWFLSFVESPSQEPFDFHPALAVADGPGWCDGLRLVGAASDLHACEGPVLARHEGAWRLLASDGDARRYPAYDLRMQPVGEVDAPYGSNLPHPQLVPLPDGGELIVTFDGTPYDEQVMGYGGHGDVLVYRAVRAGMLAGPRRVIRRVVRRVVRRVARKVRRLPAVRLLRRGVGGGRRRLARVVSGARTR